MVDLKVDYELLKKSEKQLDDLRKVFQNMEGHKDDVSDIWGAVQIRDKMGSFVDNWDNYRNQLLKDIGATYDKVRKAKQRFRAADKPDEKGKNSGKGGS
ncbi:hypothetical protein [Streptomyces sp. ODS28]|uniref:hypothetical protein n=1 Tax=Streptomyces sp. ODS28 TaxID=3136688 RepID=UPI0031EB311A